MSAVNAIVEAFRLASLTCSRSRRTIRFSACIYGIGRSTGGGFCARAVDTQNATPKHAASAIRRRDASWKVGMVLYYGPIARPISWQFRSVPHPWEEGLM